MKKIIFSAVFALFLLAAFSIADLALTAPAPGVFTVSDTDLKTAGFTAVKNQAVAGSEFQLPVKYFRVGETVIKTHPEWGDTANLVSVFIMTRHDSWLYQDGNIETINFAGRTQVRVAKTGYYIVVTGPDQKKVSVLVDILINK
jgi:hypothetical protein